MRQEPRPGRESRPGRGWRVGVVLASVLVLGPALVGDDAVQAAQRRATLGVRLRVLTSCSVAVASTAARAVVDPVCAGTATPMMRVEAAEPAGADEGGDGADPAVFAAPTSVVAVEPDGVRYLTVIY